MKIETSMKGIDQLPSGLWRVRVQYKGKKLCGTAPTFELAVGLRDTLKRDGKAETFVKVDELSIRGWGTTWLKTYRVKNSDYKNECNRFKTHIVNAPFAAKPLKEVTRDDIELWCESLATKVIQPRYLGERDPSFLSFSTRKHCLDLVRALFKDAMKARHRYCTFNPALGYRLEKSIADLLKGKVLEHWPLRGHEVDALIDSYGDDPERWIVGFAVGTGIRQGEQWRLKLSNVHLDVEVPYIFIEKGKTVTSTRKVPLFGLGLESIRRWLAVLDSYCPPSRNVNKLVFPTQVRVGPSGRLYSNGGRMRGQSDTPAGFNRRKGLLSRDEPIWWHLLRHTCATSLLCGWWGGQKWTLQEIGKLLGHSSTKTTEMYAHFVDSPPNDVVQKTQAGWEQMQGQQVRNQLRLVG